MARSSRKLTSACRLRVRAALQVERRTVLLAGLRELPVDLRRVRVDLREDQAGLRGRQVDLRARRGLRADLRVDRVDLRELRGEPRRVVTPRPR
ncbi:MAG: hypothetical protein GX100_07595 [candidate division WS1 bacterium]|nr:hypothetical protein [candidate division WS1 bacterium]